MSLSSFSLSAIEHPSTQQLKTIIHNMKVPYLQQIDQAKHRFRQHTLQFRTQQQQNITNNKIEIPSPYGTQLTIFNSDRDVRMSKDNRWNNTQSSFQQIQVISKQPHLGEWVMGGTKASIFNNLSDMAQHYTKMFDKKVKFCKAKNAHNNNTFIQQEKDVIERIYQQLSYGSQKTVYFTKIVQFFQQCPLFYTIYNIHPASLLKIIKDSAHHHEDKLTKAEFMNLFLINNRSNKDYENFNVQKIQKRCILNEQKWKDIKQVFILFDTFGNETVQLKQFLNKFRVSIQHKHLLDWEVLNFETIGRTYSLRKILFELQYKLNISDRHFMWEELQQMITNFQHIKEPTIDMIEKQKIKSGKISNLNYTFMLKDQVLDFIKQVFSRCPKYCQNFVKVSQFCGEIYQSQKSKLYLGQIVRNVPQLVTLKQVLTSLSKDAYEYLDLDQIIEQFSLKTPLKVKNKTRAELKHCFDSQSEDQQFQNRKREKQLNKKQSEKVLKKHSSKPIFRKENTVPYEFHLSKKSKQTIRQKKLNEMLQQKAKQQQQQCSKRFKAHPIPSSTNNQNYEQYKKRLAQNKESIKKQLKRVTEQDEQLIKYLQSNTKLFQKPKIQESSCTSPQNKTFQHTPVPWFVHVNLLDKIQSQKEQKSKQIQKQTNIKYLNDWKKLPFCAQSPISSMQILPKAIIQQEKQAYQNQFLKTDNDTKERNKSKVKEVPNFDLLHKQFEYQLQHKKMKIKSTKIVEFNLTSPKNKEKPIECTPVSQRPVSQNKKSRVEQNTNYIGSTLKYQSMIRLNHQKKIWEQLQQQQLEEQDRRRQKSRKMFAKLLRKQLKKQAKSSRSVNSKSRVTSQDHNNQKQLAEMYKRVFARPFLFQQPTSPAAKFNEQNASRVYLGKQKSKMDQMVSQIQSQDLYYDSKVQREEIIGRQSI